MLEYLHLDSPEKSGSNETNGFSKPGKYKVMPLPKCPNATLLTPTVCTSPSPNAGGLDKEPDPNT